MSTPDARRRTRRSKSDCPDPPPPSNEVLARRLHTTFEKKLKHAGLSGLHCYVRQGTVTIYGVVRHELDRRLICSLARQVPGVEDVVDHLQIAE